MEPYSYCTVGRYTLLEPVRGPNSQSLTDTDRHTGAICIGVDVSLNANDMIAGGA